jgi:catechol 2,3-dioxygenase-like lactoylglutathione lyase family enzyme
VLTVKDIDATCRFFAKVLGMEVVTFGDHRKALVCGSQRINLHQAGQELEPMAYRPTPGSADLCFLVGDSLENLLAHVQRCGIAIIQGPVRRMGAAGELESVYVRDPDLNLIEVATLKTPFFKQKNCVFKLFSYLFYPFKGTLHPCNVSLSLSFVKNCGS